MWPPRDGASADLLPWKVAIDGLVAGDWRTAYRFVREVQPDGTRETAHAQLVIRMLARGMHLRAYGDVDGSWKTLCGVAALFPPAARERGARDKGRIFVAPAPGEHGLWDWLMCVARREEDDARGQRRRIRQAVDEPPPSGQGGPEASRKERALIEACGDQLTWVDRDPTTWCAPIPEELLAVEGSGRERLPDPRALVEIGREYFLRRATAIHHAVAPFEGSVNRRYWDRLEGYRGLRGHAYESLAARANERPSSGIPHRTGHRLAVQEALLVTNGRRGIMD